jgi:hypothetical protein
MEIAIVNFKDIAKQKNIRLDAKYWIKQKMRSKDEITKKLKELQKEKSSYVKEHKSLGVAKNSLTNKIHNDLINIYDLQITTLNWVLAKRKELA